MSRDAQKSSRPPRGQGLIVLAVMIVSIVIAFAVWPRRQTEQAEPAEPSAAARPEPASPEPAPSMSAGAPGASLPPADAGMAGAPSPEGEPFATKMFSEPAPQVLNDARARHARGQRFPAPMRMDLYRYGEANPHDARPQLLLAFDEVKLKWWHAAVGHYEKALEADPRTGDNPKVLHDLITAMTRGQKDRAGAAIEKYYGKRAVNEVDAAIEEAREEGNAHRVRVLEELRDAL